MLDIDISSFIEQEQLPQAYQQLSQQWFTGLAEKIVAHQNGAGKPLVVGINGAQGSGKSTLAALLCYILKNHFKLNTVALSVDDFYLTRAQRQTLANDIHPLLLTRGVPGTHDVDLAIETLTKLKSEQLPVAIPRFDKAIDDRAAETESVSAPVDVIVFEGWCLGAEAEDVSMLNSPVNDLEANEDADQVWRRYVNTQLAEQYPALFNLVDTWVMLKAPSFNCVYQWRLEQENKLREKSIAQKHVMDEQQVARFIQFYQRTTENILKTLPNKVHYLYALDKSRQVTKMTTQALNKPQQQWLVFTDMDGSLLDHYTYQFDEAVATLEQLKQQQIPVIPITSKTQAELEHLRLTLENTHPFIIENGAAVFIPKGYFSQQPEDTVEQGDYWVKAFVSTREHWQQLIAKVTSKYEGQFTTFTDAGIDGIVEMTGLDAEAGARAAQRQYGEPLAWEGNSEEKRGFIAELRQLGANVLEGGRFVHVSGKSDKGVALKWLTQIYQAQETDQKVSTIALGDSQNDIAMLEVADCAVIILSPTHGLPTIKRKQQMFVSSETGPAGWAEGIHTFIGDDLTDSNED